MSDSGAQYESSSEDGNGLSNRYINKIELEIRRLEDLIKENNTKQDELKALRDGVSLSNSEFSCTQPITAIDFSIDTTVLAF
jgi:hypothetical protein